VDQHQVWTWHSFHRHTVLSMCAQALLAVARPAPPGSDPLPADGKRQPAAWRDTGKLPASADDKPPGDDPGLVKVSVPEARRLLRVAATTPMSRAARDQGYAWSRWVLATARGSRGTCGLAAGPPVIFWGWPGTAGHRDPGASGSVNR